MNRTLVLTVFILSVAGLLVAMSAVDIRPAAAEDAPTMIGAAECKSCHFKQFKSWSKGTLATAFTVLQPGEATEAKEAAGLDVTVDYTQDATCLKCHTTAYGTDIGYPALPAEGASWTEEEQARAELNAAVTCEACHGPGSLYGPFKKENKEYQRPEIIALGAISPPTAETCAPCHANECPTMPDDYAFDFEAARTDEAVHQHKPLKYDHGEGGPGGG
ncbi:MAG: cytochrome c family protein [Planctomycetota bacterium]|jgi:hypothetical protein